MKNLQILVLFLIILLNMGFSYKLFSAILYSDSYDGIVPEINKILSNENYFYNSTIIYKEVGDVLKQQKGIEDSYVMANLPNYSFYANSNFLYTDFDSGIPSDSLQDFIEQKNWSELELYSSQLFSYPRTTEYLSYIVPDYIVYSPHVSIDNDLIWYQKDHPTADISLLANPDSIDFPKNFELLYHFDKSNTFVYKIHHEQ